MTKQNYSFTFLLLTLLFCICLIVSNLMEIKVVNIGFITVTAGVAIFPISYIINDCIVELYGFNKARMVIWLGFAMNMLVSLLLQIAIWLPGAESWQGQEAMQLIFGAVPRIFAASFIAFLCGSLTNAFVMHRMKTSAGGKGRFSVRAIVSTLWGESVDSLIFFPIAFGGVLPLDVLAELIVNQIILKTGYEILILPVTVRTVKYLRKVEGIIPISA